MLGEYPQAILSMPGAGADVISNGDLALISAPLDFYGVSYAHPTVIAAVPANVSIPFSLEVRDATTLTDGGWPDHPESLTRVLTELAARYPSLPPVYVTGIGGAYDDAHV